MKSENKKIKEEGKESPRKKMTYEEIDYLIELIVCDLVNGLSRFDIIQKFKKGEYEPLKGESYKEQMAYKYIQKAYKAVRDSRQETYEELMDTFWMRYEQIYIEAIETGQLQVAANTLNLMQKNFGLAAPEKKEIKVQEMTLDWNFGDE